MSEAKRTSETAMGKVSQGSEARKGRGMTSLVREAGHRAFVENAALKFVALVLALTVFVLVHSDENDVYHPWVSVTYSQEEGRVMTSKRVDQVQISVRGTRRRIKRLQKQRLESIHVDASRLSNGDLLLEPSMFNLPEGVELISVNPPSIHLEFDERDEKLLTVEVDTVGLPAGGFRLGSAESRPRQVRVSGARKVLATQQSISTEPVNLTGRTQTFEGAVKLVSRDFDVLEAPSVNVNVEIVKEVRTMELAARKIELRPAKGLDVDLTGYVLEPTEAQVTMYSSVHALEALDTKKIVFYVEITANDLIQGMPRKLELKVDPRLSDIAYTRSPTEITVKAVPLP